MEKIFLQSQMKCNITESFSIRNNKRYVIIFIFPVAFPVLIICSAKAKIIHAHLILDRCIIK